MMEIELESIDQEIPMKSETTVDQELASLAALVDTLEPLDLTARRRVLDWACDRF